MVDITETFVTEYLLKVQTLLESIKYKPFWNQYVEKCSAGKWYIDGWIKLPKKAKENTI